MIPGEGKGGSVRTIPAATSQSGSAAWGQYRAWNAAIETYFFSGRFAGRPVYIDLNPETLSAIGEAVDVEIADARKALVDAVKATLALTLAPNPFQAHLYIANAWRRKGTGESPPFLALLAFFSLVAEAMTADEQFVANNYYDRLCSMLGVEKEDVKDRIKEGYREAALPLWDALNSWLNDWSGERGLPTARSLDVRKYVSTAISQALIRDHDRLQLRRLFGDYKLAAGQQLQPLEMKQLLAHWISRGHQNSSLFRLWRKGDEIQSRIAQLACAELEAWDGKGEAQGRGGQVPLTLMAELRTHPLPSIELYLVANSASRLQGKYKLASSSDDAARRAIEVSRGVVELQSMPRENQFSLEPWSSIRVGDAMLARLELEPTENWRPRLTRVGQPLCVLSYRELEGQFREINQAQMMDTTLVLAHETLRDTVALHLAQCARPGYREMSARSLSGLPSKWVAFLDVEIARSVASDGLEALTPASERQLLVAKGMSLDRGTWHSGDPPEVRVSAEGGERFEVRLNQRFSLSRSVQPMVLGSFEGASALPLKGSGLPDGDYEISIQSVRGSKRAAETSFRLRSSSNPRPLAVIGAGRVAHILKAESPLGVLSASLYREDDASNSDNRRRARSKRRAP